MIKLSKRLSKIAELVPTGTILADIGTDHGYLPIYLIERGLIVHAYACDVNLEPLKSAMKHISDYQILNIDCLLGSGLMPIEGKYVDVVTISGMGGALIKTILEDAMDYLMRHKPMLIIQPNVGAATVRRLLKQMNYQIIHETIVFERGKFYPIIQAQATNCQLVYNDLELMFGPILLYSTDFIVGEFFKDWIKSQERILKAITDDVKKQKIEDALAAVKTIRYEGNKS